MRESTESSSIIVQTQPQLMDHIVNCVDNSSGSTRTLIAIAGPPASGKSTLLENLVSSLGSHFGLTRVIGIPMDGFHLDNVQLEEEGWQLRKGAPYTFDAGGLLSMVQRIAKDESPVFAPEFDRTSDLSRNCAIKINGAHDIVLIEGNYLLLDQPVWKELVDSFDLTISVDVADEILIPRLVQRWLDNGLTSSSALVRAESNDIPNAQIVRSESISADILFQPIIDPNPSATL